MYCATHFNIACKDVKCDPGDISVSENYVLHVGDGDVVASPVKKIPKASTPHKCVNMDQLNQDHTGVKANQSARGSKSVRELYKKDESKILPHIRMGLNLDSD